LCGPQGIALDAHGNLYVSDTGNNRILVDQNPQTTDKTFEMVYGQPDLDTIACIPGTGGAAAVCDPRGVAVFSHVDGWGIDQGDDLYIADHGNNRVLLYREVVTKPAGAGADAVFGQGGDLAKGACGQGADGLCGPRGVAMDRGGNLLVADTDNNRVLVFDDPLDDTTADRVFGQTSFGGSVCNGGAGSPSADSLCEPTGVATSGAYAGSVVIGDAGNDRIVGFVAPYCIESFSLTAANRRTRGLRSRPMRTKIKIDPGVGPGLADDTIQLQDKLVLLEDDGGIYPNDAPLFTLATDPSFSSGVAFKESVPSWISNVRVTNNGGIWSTGDLELDSGITFYEIKESFFIPPGFGDAPQRDTLAYKALAVGEDVSMFTGTHAWFRAQFGSTCFTTELKCGSGAKKTCSVAPAAH
jgi:hypothetical protein